MSNRRPIPGVLESSPVDQHISYPASGFTGTRGARTRFSGEETSVPESEWPPHLGQAASELAKSCRASVGRAKVYRKLGEVVFRFDTTPDSDLERLSLISEKIARRHGVASFIQGDAVFLSAPVPEKRGAFGKLYAAGPYAKPQPSGIGDAGVLRTQSGWSGYRGGRDPLPSSIVGPEVKASDYAKFGAEGDSSSGGSGNWDKWGHGRVKTPIVEYEGPGVAVITIGALALFGYALSRSR